MTIKVKDSAKLVAAFKEDLMEYIDHYAQSGDVIQNHIINHLYELFPGDENLTIEEMNKIDAFVDDLTQSTVMLFDEVFDKHFPAKISTPKKTIAIKNQIDKDAEVREFFDSVRAYLKDGEEE
jgi:hypothetical protein